MNPNAKPRQKTKEETEVLKKLEEAQREAYNKLIYTQKNKWKRFGYYGKDFELTDKTGKVFARCHQTVSGTLYLYEKNSRTRHKVTEEFLNKLKLEQEMNNKNSVVPANTLTEDKTTKTIGLEVPTEKTQS